MCVWLPFVILYVFILVEDERENLFGGYIGNEIIIDENVKDPTCYVFSMRKNGIFHTKRYERNANGHSYWIANDSQNLLIMIGVSDDKSARDITLYKKDYSSGYCRQQCYKYSGESFALIGKFHFNVKRIVVYQLQ